MSWSTCARSRRPRRLNDRLQRLRDMPHIVAADHAIHVHVIRVDSVLIGKSRQEPRSSRPSKNNRAFEPGKSVPPKRSRNRREKADRGHYDFAVFFSALAGTEATARIGFLGLLDYPGMQRGSFF